MRRKLFNLAAVLSVVLCSVTAMIWLWPTRIFIVSGHWTIYREFNDGIYIWNSSRSHYMNFSMEPELLIFISVALLTVVFVPRYITKRVRAGRAASGKCLTCGYDLRGTPDRCPECGTGRNAEVRMQKSE
jgi:hypothetical protein